MSLTVDVYPNGTTIGEWTPSAGGDHSDLVNQTYPPGDNSTYVSVSGFSGGFQEEYTFPQGAPDINRVVGVVDTIYLEGVDISNVTGLRIEFLVGGVVKHVRETSVTTGSGTWLGAVIDHGAFNIPGYEWSLGHSVRFTPINGDAGYSTIPTSP